MIVLLLVVYTRRRRPFAELNPDADTDRDNQMNYGVEGGGEMDNGNYAINPLRKPVLVGDGKVPKPAPRSGQLIRIRIF